MGCELLVGRIDPYGGWFCGRHGRFVDEAVGVGLEGLVEGFLSGGVDRIGLSVVDLIGGHQADADMVVILVVLVEEGAAEDLGVLDAAEPLWELGLIFEGLEVALREGIIVGGVGPAV